MLKQYDSQTARQSLLKRTPPDETQVSQRTLDRMTQLFGEAISPEQAVSKILHDVRINGDAALQKWTHTLDQIDLAPAPVSKALIRSSLDSISAAQRDALEQAAARIEAFHRRQPVTSWFTNELGGTLGQIIRPIQRVGLYVPGGTAPLPSTVLMSVIPARVAGVKEVVLVTPPNRALAGKDPPINPMILAACAIAGVDEIYALGGAQAIAALAYGTESIQAVDKIFGPGNLFVTLAKRQVYGVVGIDGLAGPTETVVIADESANPAWVAADLLAQAEHDILASAILLTPSQGLIEKIQLEAARQIEECGRAEIIAASIENRGGIVLTRDLDEAIELANHYAPEHLALSVRDPWRWVEKINNAGGIFLGEHSYEVLGDYLAGPSHVMPTGGSARFASPLNVMDFVKIISLIALDEKTAKEIGSTAAILAEAEGLDAHKNAALIRLEETK
ncbi:MAG TPA: histidinol dehydrogenase [Anaerolineales bacterium]|nr:histidinol dehydrogenase [Anaerolineales bacterium]